MKSIQKLSRFIQLQFSMVWYRDNCKCIANRSFCYLRMERCGDAIRDADKAIELDPTYAKGYRIVLSYNHSDIIVEEVRTITLVISSTLCKISVSVWQGTLLMCILWMADLSVVE